MISLPVALGIISLAGLVYQIYRDTKNHKSNEEKIGVIIKHLPEVAQTIDTLNKSRKKR